MDAVIDKIKCFSFHWTTLSSMSTCFPSRSTVSLSHWCFVSTADTPVFHCCSSAAYQKSKRLVLGTLPGVKADTFWLLNSNNIKLWAASRRRCLSATLNGSLCVFSWSRWRRRRRINCGGWRRWRPLDCCIDLLKQSGRVSCSKASPGWKSGKGSTFPSLICPVSCLDLTYFYLLSLGLHMIMAASGFTLAFSCQQTLAFPAF